LIAAFSPAFRAPELAELLIHCYAPEFHCSIFVEIESHWAKVKVWDPSIDHSTIPALSFRPFDNALDILFASPSEVTLSALSHEFDIHVPRQLSNQTSAHWVACAVDRTVLIQPVEVQGSLQSPLLAIETIAQTLKQHECLLICEGDSLLFCTRETTGIQILLLPFTLEVLLDESEHRGEWLAHFPPGAKIFLIGSEAGASQVETLSNIPSLAFQLLPIQNILALVGLDASARPMIEANIGQYALALGLAAHLANGKLRPLLVR
jgi:hypothetical protein